MSLSEKPIDEKAAAEKAARRAKNEENRKRREARAAEKAEKELKKAERKKAAEARAERKKAAETGGEAEDQQPTEAKAKKTPEAKAEKKKAGEAKAKGKKKPEPPQRAIPAEAVPAPSPEVSRLFNILIIAQAGRLEYQAALFAESLRSNAPSWRGRLIVAEPNSAGAWSGADTRISDATRAVLQARGAEITPFTAHHFGKSYPQGNKIEALSVLPPGEDFVFFDTDTLVSGPLEQVSFDFSRPSASMHHEGTWPSPPLYGPGYNEIWKSLYDRFDLDFESSLDLSQPDEHWERYLYFNAGWFFGADPAEFGRRFLDWSRAIWNSPGEELASQKLEPWLDQVALPLVIHSLGGGRPGPELDGLDGEVTCHWRHLPLLYACGSDCSVDALERAAAAPDIQKLLKGWKPADKLIHDRHGLTSIRPLFDRENLPSKEQAIRQQIKRAGWWVI
ncbi:cell envelope integrity protein TolA [Paracoccus sp. SCSIO 75233]|uniref:cell envelope integrity protein TolA n=1 Tax=Paracoccus sp. SCSIO 75233 TaxID=3017782 RepID=UPI0022F03384|nr:hypothetical protein [Paracoccus sp. SCSIO 75233]WBU53793.1 hypothetical protein PAF12_02825 [Paracoccus sp. SCSIO 75233]